MKFPTIIRVTTMVTAFVGYSAAAATFPDAKELRKMNARLAKVDIGADLSKLTDGDKDAVAKLVKAARVMDTLFLRQVWAENETVLLNLACDHSELGAARLEAFLLNAGPWSRIDENRPFLPNVPEKPASANFYPAGATKADVEIWQKSLVGNNATSANGFFTTIRRTIDGRFMSVPYSVEYQGELAVAATLLREAAQSATDLPLRKYLVTRAEAFLSNDYYASDIAWMELNGDVEPVIGPYEVYEDNWLNAKAAFEAFVTIRDDVETKRLEKFAAALQDIEDHLPIDAAMRNPKLGAMAPIRVVNSVFSAGDGNRGVQTAAFNLPNDERVTREMGSKRVMLKNIQQAKFGMVLIPISKVALSKADQKRVSFDAFFTHILMHELMHGLGPHGITVSSKETTVRAALQDDYSAIEEAKADISGLWALQYLVDKGVLEKQFEQTLYTTFLASSFRSIRFGIHEAHGKGIAVQLNYLLDTGAFQLEKDGTFAVNDQKVKQAVLALTQELLTIEGTGDKTRADALLHNLGVLRPEVKKVLDKLGNVPIDIAPRYITAEML